MFRRALIMFFLVAIVRYIVVACPGTEKQLKKTEEIKCVLFFIMTTEKCKMFPRTLITLFLVSIVRYTASIFLRTQKQKQIKKKLKRLRESGRPHLTKKIISEEMPRK